MTFQTAAQEAPLHDALFERSPVPQVVVGLDGRYVEVNSAFCTMIGVDRHEVLMNPPAALTHPSDPGRADRALADLLQGRTTTASAERVFRHATGRPVPVLVNAAAVVGHDGELRGGAAHVQDLTVLRTVERRLAQQELFYEALGARSRDAAIVADADGRMVFVSPAVRTMLGYEPDDVVSLEGWDFVHEDDVPWVHEVFRGVVDEGGTATCSLRIRAADGTWREMEETMTNLLHTPIGGVVCNLVDVTDLRAARRALALSEARHRAIVETAREGIWVVDEDGRTDYVNAAMARILGLPIEQLHDQHPADLFAADEAEAARMRTRVRERAVLGAEEYDLPYRHPDGSERLLHVAATPIAFGEGAVVGSLAMVTDVTVARQAEDDLRRAALTDVLTGLPNRTLLADRLEQALVQREAHGGDVYVLMVDVDRFKQVNAAYGHEVGDEVLATVAARLSEVARPHDTVARLGGDDFILLATGEGARDLPAKLLEAFEQPVVVDGQQVPVSICVGGAACPPEDGTDLLRRAGVALLAAKASGAGRARDYSDDLVAEAEQRVRLTADLRVALAEDRLTMHYQPIVELATGEVQAYEALARWERPDRAPVPPEVFVPLAESVGLALELDRWALRTALSGFARLRAQRTVAAGARVAVNLCALNLAHSDLEQVISRTTAEAGLLPTDVALEITETSLLVDFRTARATLARLRERGFLVELDDFGTGYSAIAYLRDFPVSTVKVDRSFIAELGTEEESDSASIVRSILHMAGAVGVSVVAEGVETAEQAIALRQMGCHSGQGYFWSTPLSASDLASAPHRYPATPLTAPARRGPARDVVGTEHGLHRIMALQEQGASLATIAAALNREGFQTPKGQRWHQASVARAISASLAGR